MRKTNHFSVLRSLVLGLAVSVCPLTAGAVDDAKEHEIKAAYLFSLGSYITWPESLFQSDSANFTLCVLGDNPALVSTLNFIAPKRKINNRSSTIQALARIEDGDACQILYIDRSLEASMTQINTLHSKKPVLLVSDMERFIRLGGMVEFYMLDNKVRLALDPETITDAGLKPSSQLMRVAQLRTRE